MEVTKIMNKGINLSNMNKEEELEEDLIEKALRLDHSPPKYNNLGAKRMLQILDILFGIEFLIRPC